MRRLVLIPLVLLPLPAFADSVSCEWFEGRYHLNISHVKAVQTLSIRYEDVGYMLGGQQMSGISGLVDARFSSDDLQINWSYDGDNLKWRYDPPLKSGKSITYTRILTIETEMDSEGFREFPLMEIITDNASMEFFTRDVDIIYASLPLADDVYSGNISSHENYLIYSSSYKLFNYSWRSKLSNVGSEKGRVKLNTSVPRNGGNQHVISGPVENIVEDSLGNRHVYLEFVMPPGGMRDLEMEFQVLTETWEPGEIIDQHLPTDGLDRYLAPDERFWQFDDPRISAFASDVAGNSGRMATLRALSRAISNRLEYVVVDGRRGALWAYENEMGSCMEYADLFVASSRSLGIPSLYVTGVCGTGDQGDAGHAWAAAYHQEKGWFGVDPTWPGAVKIDSGRLILRYCNPEDIGMSLSHVGGDVSVDSWGEEWGFIEVTGARARKLLGIDEGGIAVLLLMAVLYYASRKSQIRTGF